MVSSWLHGSRLLPQSLNSCTGAACYHERLATKQGACTCKVRARLGRRKWARDAS